MRFQVSVSSARRHCGMAHSKKESGGGGGAGGSPGEGRAAAPRPIARRQPCLPMALAALVSVTAASPAWAEGSFDLQPTDLQPTPTPTPTTAAPPCASPLLEAALAAHERLCQAEECAPEDLSALDAAIAFLRSCAARQGRGEDGRAAAPPSPGDSAGASRWIFPVSRMRPRDSMGGPDGRGYLKNRRVRCYASARAGHPAHDLFVRDRRQSGRDSQGRPFEALAVERGYVLAVKQGWTPQSAGAGGNYVLLYLPDRNWVAYYAHLESVAVRAGDRLEAGAVIGVIGRSGRNAWRSRSPTHLHFAIWNPADAWMPLDPYALLRGASTLDGPPR